MKPVYLDYAAATPIDPSVLEAMQPYFVEKFYNPSALYSGAREVKSALDDARASVARSLGARQAEITFTAGGTESANLALQGIMDNYPDAELLVSTVEHDAVLSPAKQYNMNLVPVDHSGLIDIVKLRNLISEKTVLISVMYANNEVGTVQPIRDVVTIVAVIRKQRQIDGNPLPLYVHTDACQAPQYLDVNVARLGIDLMTLNGGKLYGPKQSGILFHKTGVLLQPQIRGGGQEYGLRSGTENVAACVGFARALELALKRKNTVLKLVQELREYFVTELTERFDATINGNPKLRLPNTVHVTFTGADNERMLFSLDDQGIFAATGSACSASSEESSHVLLAMGISEKDARSSLRFSLGKETTKSEIDRALDALAIALKA